MMNLGARIHRGKCREGDDGGGGWDDRRTDRVEKPLSPFPLHLRVPSPGTFSTKAGKVPGKLGHVGHLRRKAGVNLGWDKGHRGNGWDITIITLKQLQTWRKNDSSLLYIKEG